MKRIIATICIALLLIGTLAGTALAKGFGGPGFGGRGPGKANPIQEKPEKNKPGNNKPGSNPAPDNSSKGGHSQRAKANQSLYLRVLPDNKTEGLGTFKVEGQYIDVYRRSWDHVNNQWWLEVSFYYKGSTVNGWTPAGRFYSDSYDLYALPEYVYTKAGPKGNSNGGKQNPPKKQEPPKGGKQNEPKNEQPKQDPGKNKSKMQRAKANQSLYLRVEPDNKTKGLGTFHLEEQYVDVYRKGWDDVNDIWWLEVGFNHKGAYVKGWTPARRFYSNTYDINALPEYKYKK